MQQVASRPKQNLNGNNQTQKIVITAITLFALSGLMMGFAVGAFTRSHKPTATTQTVMPPALTKQPTPQPTTAPTVDVAAVGISCPITSPSAISQVADGNTNYTLSAEIQDQSISKDPVPCGTGKDLHTAGLICKIWLTRNQDSLKRLAREQLSPVSNLQNPFPGEVQGAFQFTGNQQQVQPCNQTGLTTWSYTLSPTLKSGTYFLAVVADWQGQVFNWRWDNITIHGQGNNN